MRTTVSIDDDVLQRARILARTRHVPLGTVVSELMRRGLDVPIGDRDGFPVFEVPDDARTITVAAVHEAEDDVDL